MATSEGVMKKEATAQINHQPDPSALCIGSYGKVERVTVFKSLAPIVRKSK